MNADHLLTEYVIVLRLGLSFVAGSIIGFERSTRRQAAGLRTHTLICLGASALMVLSIWVAQEYFIDSHGDPGRIAAQVVSGIGFLGGGAIIRIGVNVKGLTTAASIWVVSAIGLLIGAGMYISGAALTVLSLFTLSVMNLLERKMFPPRQYKFLVIKFKTKPPNLEKVYEILRTYRITILSTNMHQSSLPEEYSQLVISVNMPRALAIKKFTKNLRSVGGMEQITIADSY